jgi:eukaryotic-like serine/threonine-protein kinase
MTPSCSDDGVIPAGRPEMEKVLDRFEEAWQMGTPPHIDDFVPPISPTAQGAHDPVRQGLIKELIRIDLDHRWRAKHPAILGRPERGGGLAGPGVSERPRLEQYLERYPELRQVKATLVELAGEEYRVRQLWGDQPRHDEYAARFPELGAPVQHKLAQIDAELACEGARPGNESRAITPAIPPGGSRTSGPVLTGVSTMMDVLRRSGLLGLPQMNELLRADLQSRFVEPKALGRELIQRGWLTPYQVNQLLQGRGADLVLGPYILLERLGEGGAGQVFKARHQKMDRIVAVKVLHKELLTDGEAVGRFSREIQVLSRLDHPNVVHAYDAGPCGASYFLAMEYVEGTDLARLVNQSGPLPVMQACAYLRQAALGLQHAHERGLVHRDIKPHNLILSLREGRIKVADLGLARLPRSVNEQATAALTGSATGDGLTPAGAIMMGTADYLAPEQALDFHKADIRADIYSLGCTLYFLLTGQPVFPGATLAEKLVSHQTREPSAIEKLRPDVPAGLARVLQRMLAKRPEDRYRTPAEVADAVTPHICTPDARDLEFDPGGWSVRAGAYTTWAMLCKFARRNKAFSALAVTAMVLLAWSSVVNYQALKKFQQERNQKESRTRAAVPALVEAARLAVERHRSTDALPPLDVALEWDPEAAEARLLKGQVLIVQKEFARAKEELDRYLRQQPEDGKARRLVMLCTRPRPDDLETLLDFANVLDQQNMPALADDLLSKHGRSWPEVREKLLKRYRERIEKEWPKRGDRLSVDAAGIYRLNLLQCAEVTRLGALEGMPLTELNLDFCGGVRDLTPLEGMPLRSLHLASSLVRDLTPLRGMPLTELDLAFAPVQDLTPLQGIKLVALSLYKCHQVDSLVPLRKMPLTSIRLAGCAVGDLTPLKGMPLTKLDIMGCDHVHDLAPLKGMHLTYIGLPDTSLSGMGVLRSMGNGLNIHVWGIMQQFSAEDFWKKCRAGDFMKYKE